MFNPQMKFTTLFLVAFLFGSCGPTASVEEPRRPPLRVGVTPEYPPIIFKLGGKIAGVEADLARRLAQKLDRPVQFVDVWWENQISALLAGKFDIIMSGMSITRARKIRINFTDHYLKIGLLAAMRTEDAPRYKSLEIIKQTIGNVGVIKETTGDVFVQRNFPRANKIAFLNAKAAAAELKRGSIDIFVYDAPAVAWLVSENEADLVALWEPFDEQYLAWGVRRDDPELLAFVNRTLGIWKRDGTLNRVLNRWIPDLKRSR